MTTPGARALRPEDELSHYRIVSPLGVGGMGEVYLAQDRKLERNVAIKVLPGDLVRSEERVRRFVQEAKSASSLSHPNIVTIYEIGQDAVRSPGEPPSEPVHYISMELVSGKTLATLIHEDRTDLRTLLGYLAQAADGVAKAHAAGIVHRDLKPGNIMVSADGFAKVLDFGLAKLTERREGDPDVSTAPTMVAEPTAAGVVVGTAGYMSPEQVRAKPVDHRADIFAFGCILYEAAARRRPFSAESGVETMHKILHDQPPPIEELNPRVPAELRRLIRRCLQKNPEQRLQSMKDLAIELRELVDEYDSLSATASSGSMASAAATAAALPARRGMSPLAIGAIAIVVVAGAAAVWWGLRQGGGAGDRGFQDMQLSTQTTRGDVIDAVLSQDGRYLAYTAGTAGQAGLYVRQVATGSDVEVLAPNTNGLENPAFSPDGNYLFYLMRKPDAPNYRTLFQVPSLGGTSREVTFDVDTRVTFSPDGKQLAFWRGVPQANESRLVLYDLEARRERVMASIPSDRTFSAGPAWSPDGSRIAVALFRVGGEVATELATYDVGSGRRRDLATLPVSQVSGLAWLRDGKGLVITRLEAQSGISRHVALVSYPAGGVRRVTNDFSNYSAVSVSGGDEAIGAVRQSNLANLWVADAEGGGSRRITTITNPDASPGEIQPLDARTIAFGAPRDRFLQIWTVPASGGEARPVTNDDHQKFNLVTAPGRLVFDRIDETGIHVWTSNPDGSGLRQLTRGSGEQSAGEQAISPDGRRLLYTMGFSSGIKTGILDLESGRTDSLPSAFRGGTGFSRDGERILTWRAFSDAAGISRRISYALRADDFSPIDSLRLPDQAVGITWMPDGRGLVFMDSASPVRNLMRMDFGAGAPVPVTRFTDGRVNGFDVSDDGARLAVRRNVGTGSEVWVVGSDGSRPRRIASFDPEQVFEVQWLGNEASVAILAGVLSNDAVLIRKFR